MSQKQRSNSQLSAEILKYCPNYREYDEKARQESKERINQHLQGRKNEISKCVETVNNKYIKIDKYPYCYIYHVFRQ